MSEADQTTMLIRAAARRLLNIRLPQIIDSAVEQTIHDEPVLLHWARQPRRPDAFRWTARCVSRWHASSATTSRIGRNRCTRRRTHQSAPERSALAASLHAFRIDLKTLWEALIAEGRELGVDTRADFLERSSLMVWESIEASTEEVVRGYQVAQGSREEIRSAAFEQLLLDGDHNPLTVDNAAPHARATRHRSLRMPRWSLPDSTARVAC